MSIRINCSGTEMVVSGSEPTIGGSSMYITAGQTYSGNQMACQATSSLAFSRIVKAISGSLPLGDSTGFESSPSLRFLQDKVCPVTILRLYSQPQMGAFGWPLT